MTTITMPRLNELFQTADWKQEKHVPVIDAPDRGKRGENLRVMITVGKEVVHPNKTEHHICWISLYFQPKGEKFPYEIGKCDFQAHGESIQGPDTSTVYTAPEVVFNFRTDKPGTLLASCFCNIHGLWQSSREIEIR